MNTNKTIDGVPREYVLRLTPEAHSVLLGMVEHCLNIRACMGMDEGYKDFVNERDEHDFVKELRALLDKEVSGNSRAPLPQGEPVAIVLPEFEPAFEKWWEEDGQYCRAGGGSYEKTFAYRAYEAALADVTRLNTK